MEADEWRKTDLWNYKTKKLLSSIVSKIGLWVKSFNKKNNWDIINAFGTEEMSKWLWQANFPVADKFYIRKKHSSFLWLLQM